ncbi:hypothetical protein EVAR_55984_1 [Eumeta japonica]|uniref:Uncharacterized protein n=1 Tax=Eumeta variegata TaxID=151549 RepID=A0A4C1YBF0_EUMVA|nr:hypothetical protein EVAR_55984_1 [Eumeta japonica]
MRIHRIFSPCGCRNKVKIFEPNDTSYIFVRGIGDSRRIQADQLRRMFWRMRARDDEWRLLLPATEPERVINRNPTRTYGLSGRGSGP